jgi:hypothetical protein
MVDMKDFRIENEYRAETAKKWWRFVQSDLHIFMRVGHHRIRMADKRIVADVFAKVGDTHGPNVIGVVASAPMRHMKTDDWGMLLESAYDREFLHFINNTMENMVTLWSFNVGQDVEIHKLTHLYF